MGVTIGKLAPFVKVVALKNAISKSISDKLAAKSRSIDKAVPYLFILPFVISFFIFFLFPAVYTFVLSFFRFRGFGPMTFVGLQNYRAILQLSTFWSAVRNTGFYFFWHTVPTMFFAFTFAYMLQSKIMSRVQKYFKPIVFLPQVVPIVASALIWRIMLATQFGAVNQILGTDINFLLGEGIRRWSVVVLQTWRATGWYMIIFLAGLTTVSDEIIDATKVDGAGVLRRIFSVVLPMMKPILLFVFIMNAIGSIRLFTEPNVLLSPGGSWIDHPNAMTIINIMLMNLRGGNFGMASAVGWMLFVVTVCATLIWFKLLGGKKEEY